MSAPHATVRLNETDPPYAAVLVDLDGHVLGLNPGAPFALDQAGAASTIAHTFGRLGALVGCGDTEMLFVDARRGAAAFIPLADQQLVLVIVVPKGVGIASTKKRGFELRDGGLAKILAGGAEPVSVLRLSNDESTRIIGVLRQGLRDLGCSSAALTRDDRRRTLIRLLHRCCAGSPEPEVRRCLASVRLRCGAAPLQERLGTGSFGSVYRLEDGTVLKLTRDEAEARATAVLVGRALRRFPAVLRVFRVVVLGRPTGCFGVIREAVVDAGRLTGSLSDTARTACDLMLATQGVEGTETAQRRLAAMRLPGWEAALRFAREADAELRGHGIRFGDIRCQNIGLLRGRLCFFDLSLASGPPVDLEEVEIANE